MSSWVWRAARPPTARSNVAPLPSRSEATEKRVPVPAHRVGAHPRRAVGAGCWRNRAHTVNKGRARAAGAELDSGAEPGVKRLRFRMHPGAITVCTPEKEKGR